MGPDTAGGGLPLAGLRVVDSAGETGELCSRLLADLGADVILVEPPGGSPGRLAPPSHEGISFGFAVRNTNKRSRIVDLDGPDGPSQLWSLLAEADIWVDGHHHGDLDRLGLAPSVVVARLPHLVMASVTDFGLTGPYRDYQASDPVVFAMSASLHRAGIPELPPVLAPGRLAYDVTGVTAAFACLLAYWQRLATGRGQHLDISALEANAQTTDWGLAGYSLMRENFAELRSGAGPIYPLLPCADGFVRPSIVTASEFRTMTEWMGAPAYLRDGRWDSAAARAEIRDELTQLYRSFFADKSRLDLAVDGQRHRMTITPVLDVEEIRSAPHFDELGTFASVDLGPATTGQVPSGYFEIDGRRIGVRAPAPEPGGGAPPSAYPTRVDRPDEGESGRPFRGLRVLDFGVAGAGPETGRLFAEYGAEVINVESRDHPDLFRTLLGSDCSPMFASSNRSKRSFGVDAKHPLARPALERLVAASDVVVENLPTGTMERLGLGWNDIHRINPRVVMVSSQLMGSRGAWKDWRGYGANTQPVAGLTSLWSFPDLDGPVGVNTAMPDHLVGRLGAVATVACLLDRLRTGRGAHIEIAEVEVIINLLAEVFAQASVRPGSVHPRGNQSERGAPWGVYPCAGVQRWVVVTCRDDEEWARLRSAMGDPPWTADPVLAHPAGRRERHDLVDEGIAAWTRQRSDREAMEHLQAHGIAAGMMMYISDQPTDPHLRARGYVRHVDQPDVGPLLMEGPAFYGTDLADPIIEAAPRLGADTPRICIDLLGLTPAEVDHLLAAGALHAPAG